MDILIIEDNNRYAEKLIGLLQQKLNSNKTFLSRTIGSGYREILKKKYNYIFCDITINRPLAGLMLLFRIRKMNLENIILMSTALDNAFFFRIVKLLLMKFLNISYLCKKSEVLDTKLRLYKLNGFINF